jgi:hypothetical protein
MTWYYSDGQQQQGPVSEEELVALRRNGTVTAASLVWREGMSKWLPYQEAGPAAESPVPPAAPAEAALPPIVQLAANEAACAECGKAFPKENMIPHGGLFVCAECKPVFMQKLAEGVTIRPYSSNFFVTEEELLSREYRVEIGESLTRAWETFQRNAGTAILTSLVVGAILFGGAMVSNGVGFVVPLTNLFLPLLYTTPLLSGALWLFVKLLRQEPAAVGDAFAGFSNRYGNLLAYGVAETVLSYVFLAPAFLLGVGAVFLGSRERMTPELLPMLGVAMLLFLLGTAYLSTTFGFTAQLIIDKDYGFWPAMKLSFRMVHRRWWMTFAFLLVAGITLVAGCLLCGLGALVSFPLFLAMRAALYNDNFRDLMPRG